MNSYTKLRCVGLIFRFFWLAWFNFPINHFKPEKINLLKSKESKSGFWNLKVGSSYNLNKQVEPENN